MVCIQQKQKIWSFSEKVWYLKGALHYCATEEQWKSSLTEAFLRSCCESGLLLYFCLAIVSVLIWVTYCAKCTFSWIRNICVGSLCRTPNWSSRCHICALGSLTIGRKLHSGDRCCWTVEDIVFWPLYARRMLHWQNVWSCMEINGWWLWILAFNMLKNINSE